ncbi:uncharacterized protein LOC127150859 [Cucumis melo]|uniref:Uncharacterized protein LOC127150859 n=1 Tax=Cucumis melo TaxID=3656 RepID=A0ABM3L654_CUCME|nr:uncharacterized protein LOC127150859 [Cucumis melo]
MSDQVRAEYRTRLGASIDCTRFLLRQGLSFRGHNETDDSKNQDIVNCIATEIANIVIRDVSDKQFSILIDESRDISLKEQMSVVLRYVDEGHVIERFIRITHFNNTSALSLKEAIDDFFSQHGLSITNLRGQGYDGASNMQSEFHGLKSLILKENECASYIHCFAHQLQLALVNTAKNHVEIVGFIVKNVVNVIGASVKHRDILREKHSMKICFSIWVV